MREYDIVKQHMAEQMRQAENMRLLKKNKKTLHKRLIAFVSQRSVATLSNRKSITTSQQYKPTTSHS